jgi:hypothetical protein
MADAGVAVVPTMVNYYQWLLVSPGDARRIVEDGAGRIDPRRRYISGYLLEDWGEQVGERGGLRDLVVRQLLPPRAYGGVLRDLREMHRAVVARGEPFDRAAITRLLEAAAGVGSSER